MSLDQGPFGVGGGIHGYNTFNMSRGVGCSVYHNANQTVANFAGTYAVLNFNSTTYDTDGMHSNTYNNTRITINVAGIYFFWTNIIYAANSTGLRAVKFRKNGSNAVDYSKIVEAAITDPHAMVSVFTDYANVGDYYEVLTTQTSGGNLTCGNEGTVRPGFSATKIG